MSYENRRTFLVRRFSFFLRLDLDQIFCETRVDRCGVVQNKKHKDFLLKQAKEALADIQLLESPRIGIKIKVLVFLFLRRLL